MKSSVYISSEKIEVIRYTKRGKRISVKDYTSLPLPEGIMINGKIIDTVHMTECLDSMRKKTPSLFNETTMIVDGNSIFSKRIAMPKLNKWHKLQLVGNEFSDATQDVEELVCDYQPIAKVAGEPAAMFACAVDRSQVEAYISTFKSAGISLETIRIGAQAIQSYVDGKPELRKTTFVLNVIDGLTLFSMIFDKGINIFTSRTRLYSDDKESFLRSLIENLSGLIQFNRSQKFNDIATSYYLGLNPEDLSALSLSSPYSDIKFDSLDIFSDAQGAAKLPGDAHFAYLNTLLGKDSIDLIRGCKMHDQLKKRKRPKLWIVPALAVLLVVLAIPFSFLFVRNHELQKIITEITNYLTKPSVTAKSEEIDEIKSETERYQYVINQLNGKVKEDSGNARLLNKTLDLVTGTHTDKVTVSKFSFDESKSTLSVEGSSANEIDSARYVDALKIGEQVKEVNYTGYSYSNVNGEVVYNFSIDLILFAEEAAE